MQRKMIYRACMILLLMFSSQVYANDLNNLFDQVEKLKIERHGYVLGVALNKEQMKTAASNPTDANSSDTFKFKDKNINVVAQKTSNRVLVIYEQFEDATQKEIQNLVGDLYMNFDDPSVLAHDKVVYWAYTNRGKITSEEFETAREERENLGIIATVKLISEIEIMEKVKESPTGQVYYIISSDPVLKFFKNR